MQYRLCVLRMMMRWWQENAAMTQRILLFHLHSMYVSHPCCLHHQTRHTFKMQDRGFVLTLYVPGEQMKNYVHQWNLSLFLQREAKSMELNRIIYPYIPSWVSAFGKRETLTQYVKCEYILCAQHSLLQLQIRLLTP